MSRDDSARDADDESDEQDREGLFHLPKGTKITFEGFGRRTEVDPESPQGDLAVLGLIACITFQVAITLLMVADSSGGIQTVTTLIMAAAVVVIALMVVSALRGSGGERTTSLMRVFCVLVLIAIVLTLAQNLDDPSQVVKGVLGMVVAVFVLRGLRA
jgi:lysylphosphatidylglycerol synthetase-like protein (DUF2156 family)